MQGPGYMFEFAPTLYKIYSEQVGITSVYGGDHSGWWLSIQLKQKAISCLNRQPDVYEEYQKFNSYLYNAYLREGGRGGYGYKLQINNHTNQKFYGAQMSDIGS